MVFNSLLRKGASYFTPPTTGGTTATKENLFPLVSKEDCDLDCESCGRDDSGYGKAFDKIGVETESELWGGIKGYAVHALVATGETDWIRDVEGIRGSVMEALSKESVGNGRLMISATNMHPPPEYYTAKEDKKQEKPTTVLILPSFTVVENVTPSTAPELIARFINPGPTTTTPLDSTLPPSDPEKASDEYEKASDDNEKTTVPSISIPQTLTSYPCPHSYLILLCSHKRRDARCGISAPILRKEFEKHLRPLGLWRDLTDTRPGGASVVFINHVGGHKFSANMLVYRKEDGMGIWLARVRVGHVEGIVKHTILEGKVVHPEMIRGGFNRKKCATSW